MENISSVINNPLQMLPYWYYLILDDMIRERLVSSNLNSNQIMCCTSLWLPHHGNLQCSEAMPSDINDAYELG